MAQATSEAFSGVMPSISEKKPRQEGVAPVDPQALSLALFGEVQRAVGLVGHQVEIYQAPHRRHHGGLGHPEALRQGGHRGGAPLEAEGKDLLKIVFGAG